MTRGRALLALQEQDERIAALRREIADLEAVLRGESESDRLREQSEAEAARRTAELAGRSVEKDLAGIRHRARTLEKRLYDGSVHNPQELLGMQHDLDSLRPMIEELEGRLLESMEVSERAEADLSQARATVTEREEERRSQEGPRRDRLAAAGRELAEHARRPGQRRQPRSTPLTSGSTIGSPLAASRRWSTWRATAVAAATSRSPSARSGRPATATAWSSAAGATGW